ncbi:hypothetical protein HDK90DRAFT_91623 [Phyllosticta capitalensis]|uniref:Uncharacterized protein n=2 Tax=Phyllosticta capitalensis TaxID=121624 RepID=A0ABR1YBL7_9PEZI
MRTRRNKPVNYKLTRTNRKRGGSPATATPKASLSGGTGASAPKKRGRPSKKDKEAVVAEREPTPPPHAPPAKGKRGRPSKKDKKAAVAEREPTPPPPTPPAKAKRGRGRPPSVRSRLAGTPSPKKKVSTVQVESPEAVNARDQRARTRRITNRNAGAPPKPAVKGKAKVTAASTKKGVKFAAGVKKSVASGKGKGKEIDGRSLMHDFFRDNRDSVKGLRFRVQQKKLGAMWKASPLNPKNETAAESNDDDENSSNSSEHPSSPGSPDTRVEDEAHPDDEFSDEMDDAEQPVAGPSSGTTEWETTDSSSETTTGATAKKSSGKSNILRHRPTAEQPYPEEDSEGIYYLTESENEEGSKIKRSKKEKSRFTHHTLKEVAISANRVLDDIESGSSSTPADGLSGTASSDEAGTNEEEEEEVSETGN